MLSESSRIPAKDEIMFSLFLSPKTASAVQLYGDVTLFDDSASFLSLPGSERLKKRRSKKRIRAIIRLLFGTNTMKADEILSDFSKGMIIRFFYRRNPSLPYASTATSRVSTLLHLFYLSPIGYRSIPP